MMTDPITWGVLGGWALSEGIKFLYGQAAELLKAHRERKAHKSKGPAEGQIDVPLVSTDVLDGTPTSTLVNLDALEQQEPSLVKLMGGLAPYAQGLADPDPQDAELARVAASVRAVLEAVYGQRFTFRGEQREPTGTRVHVKQVLGRVSGPVKGVEADLVPGAQFDVHQQATSVEQEGSMTGYKQKKTP